MEKMKSAAYSPRTEKSTNIGITKKESKNPREKVLSNVTFDDNGKVIK